MDAAETRQGSSFLLEAMAYASDAVGHRLSFSETSAATVLYGYAARMRNAGEAARAASDETWIDTQHVAVPPWAREEQVMNTSPIHHVTYLMTTENNGVITTDYKTSVFDNRDLPSTIGALKDELAADAEVLASKYRVNLLSVELHQILAV